VFSSADVIEVLAQRRRRKSIRPEAPGTLPPGWQQWLDGMSASPRAVVGALPQDVIDVLALRPLAQPPARVGNLTRWQAFGTLWRQQWLPPEREDRRERWFAAAFSGVLHVVFLVLLTILAWVHVPPPPAAGEGDTVVQVEFIGTGTPEDAGGGAPEGPAPTPSPAPAAPAAPSAAETPAQQTQSPPPSEAEPAQQQAAEAVAAQPPPEPAPPAEPTPPPQPLQVTEVTVPDSTFVLPPPRPREVQLPQPEIVVPEVRQPTPGIARVQVPTQQAIQVDVAKPQTIRTTPQLRAEEEARLAQARALAAPTIQSPELQVPTVRAQVRALPMPSRGTTPAAASGTAPSAASTAPAGSTAATTPAGGPPSPGSGTRSAAQAGTGTSPAAPGAWPTPQRGDDFGVGTRNRPGAAAPGTAGTQPGGSKPGIFNADGTPNLGTPPAAQPGPPGTVEARIADLDRAGRWLKRPPYDYTPTTFDKYWRPHETLLQEWVRKGIKTLRIPLPGGRSLECVVSLLQVGGGCGIDNPNMQNQPATARPPPDIPFKPKLQEDNGSVRPATAPAPATTRAAPAATGG
jgi:hypothetical protein